MIIEELQDELNEWLKDGENEHTTLYNGENKDYNKVFEEIYEQLKNDVENASSEEEKRESEKRLKGFERTTKEDIPPEEMKNTIETE